MERYLTKKAQSGADTIFAIATIFGMGIFCIILVFTYSSFMDAVEVTPVINESHPANQSRIQ